MSRAGQDAGLFSLANGRETKETGETVFEAADFRFEISEGNHDQRAITIKEQSRSESNHNQSFFGSRRGEQAKGKGESDDAVLRRAGIATETQAADFRRARHAHGHQNFPNPPIYVDLSFSEMIPS